MYLFNIRADIENGITAAFQFWRIPKVQIRMGELMVDFLFEFQGYDEELETTAEITSLGAVSLLRAVCNVQLAI